MAAKTKDKPPKTVKLFVEMTVETKNQLLAAIDGLGICTVTDAVAEAAKLLKTRKPKEKP